MKALIVHGGGAVFDNTSCNVGRRGQYGPVGIDRLRGLDDAKSPEDMKPSSSASQSERTDEQRGDVSRDDMCMCNAGGLRFFDFRIALRKYFMGTLAVRPLPPLPETKCGVLQITSLVRLCMKLVATTKKQIIIVSRTFERLAICTGKSSRRDLAVCF